MKPRDPRDTGLEVVLDPIRAEASLWRRARFEADAASRTTLFNRYLTLARSVAAKHLRRRSSVNRGDCEQFAYEGLLQALDRFDPLLGIPFGAYARRRIEGNIADGMARMSEIDAQMSLRRRMQRERMRSLDIPAAAGDPLTVLADLAVDLAVGLLLEGTGMMEGDDDRPDAYEGLAWRQAQAALVRELEQLPDAHATVVRQHYHIGLSFAHIADLLKLSRGRISQLHREAIERLRRRLRNYRG